MSPVSGCTEHRVRSQTLFLTAFSYLELGETWVLFDDTLWAPSGSWCRLLGTNLGTYVPISALPAGPSAHGSSTVHLNFLQEVLLGTPVTVSRASRAEQCHWRGGPISPSPFHHPTRLLVLSSSLCLFLSFFLPFLLSRYPSYLFLGRETGGQNRHEAGNVASQARPDQMTGPCPRARPTVGKLGRRRPSTVDVSK